MNSTEENYWYEGKLLNNSHKPNVYILKDSDRKHRKKIVYECKLPKSDVYLSLKPYATRSIQSRPLDPKRQTVSGLHVKLKFMPLEGINLNFRKSTMSTTTPEYPDFLNSNSNNDKTKVVQRYLLFFDKKCRNCFLNIQSSTLDSNQLVNPSYFRSIKCHLKV